MIEKENVLWQVAQQMMANLQSNNTKLADIPAEKLQSFAEGSGVFAVFYAGRELGLGIGKDGQPAMLYTDAASQIVRHLQAENTGDTGNSESEENHSDVPEISGTSDENPDSNNTSGDNTIVPDNEQSQETE